MPSPAWESLDEFLDLDTVDGFATDAVIQTGPSTTRTVRGIFDDPAMTPQAGEYTQDTVGPTLLCKDTDLVGIRRKMVATIYGKAYDITHNPKPDGTGLATLMLAPQPV